MKRFINLLPVVLCSLTFTMTGCSADADSAMTEERQKDNRIAFCLNDIEDVPATTRGAQATLSSLDAGFGVSCSVYPSSETYTSYPCGSYFYKVQAFPGVATDYYWPETDSKMVFYAYYPYGNANISLSPASTVGRMRYTYTVPDAVASHVDFMTAEVLDVTCPSVETVTLTFGHKLSDFRFLLENSTRNDVTVKSITIKNFDHTGTLIGNTWTTTGASKDFTLDINQGLSSGSRLDLTGTDNHFMLIPQTITSGKRMIDLCINDGTSDVHFYSDLTQDFIAEVGKSYQFTLRLSSRLEVSQGTSIEEWVLYIGYINYATGTSTENWTPENQPMEHSLASITGWVQENP